MYPTSHKSTNDKHGDRAADGSEDQELATTPLVDKYGQPKDRNDSLDHTEQTGSEIDGVLA